MESFQRDINNVLRNRVQGGYGSVVIVAKDSLIDEAVRLSLSLKESFMHGLHQTTQLQLTSAQNQTLSKQIFSQRLGQCAASKMTPFEKFEFLANLDNGNQVSS